MLTKTPNGLSRPPPRVSGSVTLIQKKGTVNTTGMLVSIHNRSLLIVSACAKCAAHQGKFQTCVSFGNLKRGGECLSGVCLIVTNRVFLACGYYVYKPKETDCAMVITCELYPFATNRNLLILLAIDAELNAKDAQAAVETLLKESGSHS